MPHPTHDTWRNIGYKTKNNIANEVLANEVKKEKKNSRFGFTLRDRLAFGNSGLIKSAFTFLDRLKHDMYHSVII